MGTCIRRARVTLLTPVRYLLMKHTKLPYQASMACAWKLSPMHLRLQSALQLSPTATLTNR